MSNRLEVAEIIIGSKADFTVELVDEDGKCFDISGFVSGKAVFCNCNGERIEIALSIPGANPTKGEIAISIPSIETAKFDEKSKNFDIELVDGSSETTVVVINDKIELVERNCPPSA